MSGVVILILLLPGVPRFRARARSRVTLGKKVLEVARDMG